MEIEDNEYIRTNNGTIAKIEDVEFEIKTNMFGQILYEVFVENNSYYEVITKHSKNIIDLIQCGDYVNGSLVISDTKNTRTETCDGEEHKCIIVSRSKDDVLGWKMIDFDIKDVLTKEQYEQNSYKL